jgi:hypothetical protein
MKYLPVFIFICIGLLSANSLYSQFFNSKDAYLNQKPPGNKPEVFAEKLLMKNDTFPFCRVAFSNDGKEFYYTSSNTWFNNEPTKIQYFIYKNGKWNGPIVLYEHYDSPTFSVDGNKLYFFGGKQDGKHYIVWQSIRMPGGKGWSEPFVYISSSFALYNFMPTVSGTCYAGSRVPGDTSRKDFDICELKMSPGDTVIKSLGEPINTKEFEGDFFVARDESYIIVSTNETSDFQSELWISFRKPDGKWSSLISLGQEINNDLAHRWGQYVSPDGKYLFYSTGHSPKDCHIAWVRFDHLLTKLKKQSLSHKK